MPSFCIGSLFNVADIGGKRAPPYGFRDLLQRTNQLRLCLKHDSELRYFCKDHEEELCEDCWLQGHLDHDVELLKVNKWKRLSSPWENRRIQVRSIHEFHFTNFFLCFVNTNFLQELRAFCLENVEILNKGVDCLVEQRNRYQKTADLCLSLMQKESKMNQQFQRKKVDPSELFVDTTSDKCIKFKYSTSIFASDDQSVIEFELYIQHLKEEASKLDSDMAKFAQLTDDLKLMNTRTGCVFRISVKFLLFSIFLLNLASRFIDLFYLRKS